MLNKGYQIERTSYANLALSIHERINDLHRRADGLAPAVSESALDSGCTDQTAASYAKLGPRQRRAWDMVAEAHAWNAISDSPAELAKAEAAERAGRTYEVVGVWGDDFHHTYEVRVDGDEDGEGGQDDTPEPTGPAPVPAFVADPTRPTDAELAAAIQRGLATGQLVDATDWLAAQRAQRAQDAIQASAARNGHATRCTAHGGRDLAACDPADCDEAALAASFSVTVYDSHPAGQDAPQAAQAVQTLRCRVCGHISTAPAGQDATDRLCCICFEQGSYSFLVPQAELDAEAEARREHDAAGPGHAAWCAGPNAHRAPIDARFRHQPRRGHFHDPVGLYDWCQDSTCTRNLA